MPKMYFSFQKFKKNPHACTFHQFLRKNIDIFGALEVHFCVKRVIKILPPPQLAVTYLTNNTFFYYLAK